MRFPCGNACWTLEPHSFMKICEIPENVHPSLWILLHPNTMCTYFSYCQTFRQLIIQKFTREDEDGKGYLTSRSNYQKCSIKKVLLKICNFIKKRLRRRCFPVNIAKFFKNPFFTEHLRTTAS